MTTIVGLAERAGKTHEAGIQALRNGQMGLFTGFPESLRSQFIVALRFKAISEWSVHSLIHRWEEACESIPMSQLNLFMAGRDFPVHSTVMIGVCEEKSQSQRDAIFESLQCDSLLVGIRSVLRGLKIDYPHRALDKFGNILQFAEEVPPEIAEARMTLESVYRRHDLFPKEIDILHQTLARVKVYEPPALQPFLRLVGERPDIGTLIVGDVFAGNLYDFLT